MASIPQQPPLFQFDKQCRCCGNVFPLDGFNRRSDASTGRSSYCKACDSARSGAYYRAHREQCYQKNRESVLKNPGRAAEYNRVYRRRHSERLAEERRSEAARERKREYDQGHRDRNRDRLIAKKRQYYAANKERLLAAQREYNARPDVRDARAERNAMWYRENMDKVRAHRHNRKARVRNAPGRTTPAQFAARWTYYGGLCWMCGTDADTTDHVIPLARGGTNWPANLRPACMSCNCSKQDRDWRLFVK